VKEIGYSTQKTDQIMNDIANSIEIAIKIDNGIE
jgi:hypothetical protein